MPRYYGGYTDPTEQYQGTAFDPMTGRLQGGQLVMQVLNQIAAGKRKKKEEGWELEDRAWQEKQRGRAEEQYEWEKKTRIDPREKMKYDFVMGNLGAKADEQRELRKIAAMGEKEIEVAKSKPVKTAKELDTDYLSDVQATKAKYLDKRHAVEMAKREAIDTLRGESWMYQENPGEMLKERKNIEDDYTQYLKQLESQERLELESLDERYSELPRAQASIKRRGGPKPTAPPKLESTGEIKIAGTKRRKELPEGADIRIAPDGRRLVKINGEIYVIVD